MMLEHLHDCCPGRWVLIRRRTEPVGLRCPECGLILPLAQETQLTRFDVELVGERCVGGVEGRALRVSLAPCETLGPTGVDAGLRSLVFLGEGGEWLGMLPVAGWVDLWSYSDAELRRLAVHLSAA